MDYLRTISSAVLSKSGLNLPFSLGQKVSSLGGTCNLYEATKRDDGSAVSVFEYELNDSSRRSLGKNALRKLRTMRHPDVLKFMDAVESDTTIYIMTERVRPLRAALQAWSSKGKQEREDWLLWGLQRISVALAFLNESGSSTHGSLRVDAIFMSPSGEWKLGGFEVLSNPTDESSVLYTLGGVMPNSSSWASPEVKKGGWSSLKQLPVASADAYALGLLLHSVFNPTHAMPPTADPPHPPPTAQSRGDIPTSVFPHYKKLLNPNSKARMSPKDFLDTGMSEATGFFANNRLLQVCNGLDNFVLASEGEKNTLLRTLKESASSFPSEFTSFRVLPALVSSLERGGASAALIVPLVLQFGTHVDPDEYNDAILGPLVKLYASPDRGTRMALLDHLSEYAEKLDKKLTSDKIFPHLQTGFSDTVAIIREATIKSISLLYAKLNDRLLNNDLLRHLAKMQQDPEASIRTNTCILMGRIAPSLGHNTKRKVLVPAFSRAVRDPFVHCRVAGLMAFMATIDCFEIEELANKVVPSISCAMLDKEKLVRDQAFTAVELFVNRLKTHATSMADTALSPEIAGVTPAATNQGALVNTAAGAAGALAGWAMSSISKKLATSELQSTISGTSADRPSSTPPGDGLSTESRIGNLRPSPLAAPGALSSVSAANSTVSSPVVPTLGSTSRTPSKAKGLQLGANKVPPSVAAAAAVLAEEFANENAADDDANPWGDDLMDVNADADDWSAFETAPSKPTVVSPTPKRITNSNFSNGIKANEDEDPWSQPATSFTSLSTSNAIKTHNLSAKKTNQPKISLSPSPASNAGDWDASGDWDDGDSKKSSAGRSTTPSMANMTKEEKAAEMQRRKEERKQRIAMLKEQKKNASAKS